MKYGGAGARECLCCLCLVSMGWDPALLYKLLIEPMASVICLLINMAMRTAILRDYATPLSDKKPRNEFKFIK